MKPTTTTRATRIPTEAEYQARELALFDSARHPFHSTTADFAEWLANSDLHEQLGWIENGSYGAGACLALQRALRGITPRCNAPARIGAVALHAFHGAPFRRWASLPPAVRRKVDRACRRWLARKRHAFAIAPVDR